MQTVLVVDQSELYRCSIGNLFYREGCSVHVATTGESAIKLARSCVPDILVTEWCLEGVIDGLQLARTLRELNDSLRCNLISTEPPFHLVPSDEQKWIRVTCKPFPLLDLLELLRES